MAEAWWMRNKNWINSEPEYFFDESAGMPPGRVISFTGGGGKTSLMFYLADVYSRKGLKTAVATTTRIYRTDEFCENPSQWEECWAKGKFAVCGILEGEKLRSLEKDKLDRLISDSDVLLVEADGAGRMPCKAPAEHEPVILPECDAVVGVMGLDALGGMVEKVCFRPEIVCRRLKCDMKHIIDTEDMISLMTERYGNRRNAGERQFFAVYNKCDDEERLKAGKAVCEGTEALGIRGMLTCLK